MQINIRNYHYDGNIMAYKFPQSKIKISGYPSNKVKTQPEKQQNENQPFSSLCEINNVEKIQQISLSLERRNQNFVCKLPIIYSCEIPENYYIWNKKKNIAIRSLLPYKLKYEEKTAFLKDLSKDFQSKRYSERYKNSCQKKTITQLKLQQQSKTLSKDLEFEPKGWTNKSSHSLL
ncbi:unnamed protein product (macronuclear) [Paramecium tetraurelia]|uniref:Uncharacterized protein n=1 Tax=Paramecium tetraurelia TaxID=5888 RepID=A0CN32_PARTE|nr:uncharacterized protein GSPATT00008640001 [Paramecium tetraurelia]CAK72199.1 unnamed protein product [Paramecium tetraurelia]|eukprot:XP_001439596.1 hypothetical protein (macronuclear) [Paramecium tetraurelia strain d4-2]